MIRKITAILAIAVIIAAAALIYPDLEVLHYIIFGAGILYFGSRLIGAKK